MTAPTELSERSLGWLRYLYRKAHTPDDWSKEGRPHPHWDDRSDPPMASWPRFDLVDSSYAIGLMAQSTPAWREPYVAVLDQLIERHTGWWSANDWLTQFGAEAGTFLNIQEHPRSSPRRGRGPSQAESCLGRRAPSIWRFAPLQPSEGITHHTGSPRVFSHARLRPLGIYPHESLKRPFRSFVPRYTGL